MQRKRKVCIKGFFVCVNDARGFVSDQSVCSDVKGLPKTMERERVKKIKLWGSLI